MLERKFEAGAYAVIASPAITSYTDTNLANGQYTYRIAATNVSGSSPTVESNALKVAIPVTVLDTNFDAATLPSEINPGTALLTGVQGFAGLGNGSNVFANQFLRSETANVVSITLSNLPKHSSLSLGGLFAAIESK